MLKSYHSIDVEGDGLSFLFEFTSDSDVGEHGRLEMELCDLGAKSVHEYFDKVKQEWVVNVGFGILDKSRAHGVRVQIGRALTRLGYKVIEKIKR